MESVDLHEAQETANANHIDHGWQKVSYPKRQRKTNPKADLEKHSLAHSNGTLSNGAPNVFRSLEQQSQDRRRRILEAQRADAAAAAVDASAKAKHDRSDLDDDDDSDMEGVKPNRKPAEEEKKVKQKKQKKPKVTVAEAAAKIDLADLSAYLAELNGEQQEIQMQKFANYYGKAFQEVVVGQFPWMKMFRDSTVIKLADIPLSHISDSVYKTSADWISHQSLEALGFFVLWSLDIILEDLVAQQASAKGSKKSMQQTLLKSKATERFEAIYPTVKEVALARSHGSKAMRQVSQQIFHFAVKAAGDSSPELSTEAARIVIWCLNQNADCYQLWEKAYLDNLGASVVVLRRLLEDWKQHSVKFTTLDPLRETIKNFRNKNEKAMSNGADSAKQSLFQDADKYCKHISGKLSRGHGCMKTLAFVVVAFAVGATVISPNIGTLDWNKMDLNKLSVVFSS